MTTVGPFSYDERGPLSGSKRFVRGKTPCQCSVEFTDTLITLRIAEENEQRHRTILLNPRTFLPLSREVMDRDGERIRKFEYREVKEKGQIYLVDTKTMESKSTGADFPNVERDGIKYLKSRFADTNARTWYDAVDIAIDLLDPEGDERKTLRENFDVASAQIGYRKRVPASGLRR